MVVRKGRGREPDDGGPDEGEDGGRGEGEDVRVMPSMRLWLPVAGDSCEGFSSESGEQGKSVYLHMYF